ncbi:MAG TPA: sensor histidine kinase [Candidatus Nanopelagicaceae bacterium]|nr:sensor histidine kinase [Candidatus Nanopelagicaceae bacterium]
MADLDDLVRNRTTLTIGDLEKLHAVVADWQLLADLSFADLLLWVPLRVNERNWPLGHVVVGQIRPTTGATVHEADLLGTKIAWGDRPNIDSALSQEKIFRERDPEIRAGIPVREEMIPVINEGRAIAVISRHTNSGAGRTPSRLELTYLQTANDLSEMIAVGRFPYEENDSTNLTKSRTRVGDGLMRLDSAGVVTYASPNALSALRRLGLTSSLEGSVLGTVVAHLARRRSDRAPKEQSWVSLLSGKNSVVSELEIANGVIDFRVLPLIPAGQRTGAIVLIHDVTDIRRRERELITKDATIREIHHRVKNNLQTVTALLRLQARRLSDPAGRAALEEAVRRVGSIAVVHETLSTTGQDRVAFDEVADRVIASVVEVAATAGVVSAERVGEFGLLAPAIATPLAMVLAELVQNAIEHGLGEVAGHLEVRVVRNTTKLQMIVSDDGVGLPPGFSLEGSTNLGLQIVRTLTENELGGQILVNRVENGTEVVVEIPL